MVLELELERSHHSRRRQQSQTAARWQRCQRRVAVALLWSLVHIPLNSTQQMAGHVCVPAGAWQARPDCSSARGEAALLPVSKQEGATGGRLALVGCLCWSCSIMACIFCCGDACGLSCSVSYV